MKKRVIIVAHVASMIDLFNRRNIKILQNLGYEVHIACNFENGNVTSKQRINKMKEELIEENVKFYNVSFPRNIFDIRNILKSYKSLKLLQEENSYQLVHCQGPISGVVSRLACRKARKQGTKVLYTVHGFHFFNKSPRKNWIMIYPIEKLCLKYTDMIITINGEDTVRAQRMGRRYHTKVTMIPGVGIDIDKARNVDISIEDKRKELGLNVDDIVIISVGELTKGKNQETSLKAFAKLTYENAKFVICGIGKEEATLKELAKQLSISERVIFTGYRDDIYEILKVSDIFLFPSHREGLPVAVMEAMAMGLPIIASKIRGNTDLIVEEKGGFLVEPNDVDRISESLNYLCQNKELRKSMGEHNKNASITYGKDKVDTIMKGIYRELLNGEMNHE